MCKLLLVVLEAASLPANGLAIHSDLCAELSSLILLESVKLEFAACMLASLMEGCNWMNWYR